MTALPLGVGDVWAVDTTGLAADLIRLGEEVAGGAQPASHVVIVHHSDGRGRWWGVEGRPGGVGWADMAKYTGSRLASVARTDAALPRTPAQRRAVARAAEGLLGCGYDWIGGIAADCAFDLGARGLVRFLDRWWGWGNPADAAPGHVVCSSLAAWVHRHAGLPAPEGHPSPETVQPADWWAFNNNLGAP